ncbi:MAG: CRISPR-associated endonuclease Cas3'' [Burkholderiales bacterium]|nr:CRISPR-associated endonuclease Cas3'' [Burkholderiales bacterium]
MVSKPLAHWRASDQTAQSLDVHLANVGHWSGGFASKIQLGSAGELMGLLHDLGKYSPEFQAYIKSAEGLINPDEDDYVDAQERRGKIDHSSAGAQYVWHKLFEGSGIGILMAQFFALCIASHHSGLIDCLDANGEDTFSKRMRKAQEKTHLDEVVELAEPNILARCAELAADPALTVSFKALVQRIVQLNESASPGQQQIGLMVRFLFSGLIDADRIDTADFEHKRVAQHRPRGNYVAWPRLIGRLEKKLGAMTPKRPIDVLRNDISAHCLAAASRERGVYTLTVPTGGGKTLASLRFALHHAEQRKLDRIIYVIPFTSIIDQNAQVARAILEPDDAPADRGKVVLEHHSSITPEQQTWREKILCENWDAPVVYTTMVQFLETLFGAGTRGARRMHQLANTVLIFDEVQTLPINCVHVFNNAINFLVEQCNSTVVLCTATQPLLHQVDSGKGAIHLAAQHEIMPNVQKHFDDLRRVEVRDCRKPGGWLRDEVAVLATIELDRAGSCLVIVNTKDAALGIFELCQPAVDREALFYLSTNQCSAHRKQELTKIRLRLAQGLPTLCVSTQLIEAGVDVDFGAVIRFMAGIDSIAQAAGRCNRNGRPEPGLVHIVNPRPEDERLDMLPDIATGRDIAPRVLDDYRNDPARYAHNLFGPQAMSEYFQYYFFERKGEMAYKISEKDIGHADTLLSLLSGNQSAVDDCSRKYGVVPQRMLNQSFMTAAKAFKAIDAPTQGVVVPFGKAGRDLIGRLHGAFDIELEFDLMREAQQYTVNVFPGVLKKLREAEAVKEVKPETRILTLDSRYYSLLFGLSTEPVSEMEMLYVG